MANTSNSRPDFQEVNTRNHIARIIVAVLTAELPSRRESLRRIAAALADTPSLITEITRARRERANLAAAARATLAAYNEGEPDPLFYVRDELHQDPYQSRQDRRDEWGRG
jgi:hypothetical protein